MYFKHKVAGSNPVYSTKNLLVQLAAINIMVCGFSNKHTCLILGSIPNNLKTDYSRNGTGTGLENLFNNRRLLNSPQYFD